MRHRFYYVTITLSAAFRQPPIFARAMFTLFFFADAAVDYAALSAPLADAFLPFIGRVTLTYASALYAATPADVFFIRYAFMLYATLRALIHTLRQARVAASAAAVAPLLLFIIKSLRYAHILLAAARGAAPARLFFSSMPEALCCAAMPLPPCAPYTAAAADYFLICAYAVRRVEKMLSRHAITPMLRELRLRLMLPLEDIITLRAIRCETITALLLRR